jgi:hypothetical protein
MRYLEIICKNIKNIIILLLCAVSLILILWFDYNKPQEPTIILITVEAFRPDHLGCYGYKNITPSIDKLAEKGVMFTSARVVTPLTQFSVPSMLSSSYPVSNGSISFDFSEKTFITSLLKKRGIKSVALISIQIPEYLGKFFNTFEYHDNCFSEVERAVEELDKDKKIFLWLHFPEPHLPYKNYTMTLFEAGKVENISREREIAVKAYDEEIKDVDRCINSLTSYLEKRKLIENTLLIVTGDHGEEIYEHGGKIGHGFSLSEEQLKVPLIFYYPKAFWSPKKISCPVSLIDIGSTILDILDIKERLENGKSLLRLIEEKENCTTQFTFHLKLLPRFTQHEVKFSGINRSLHIFIETFKLNCENISENFERCLNEVYRGDKIQKLNNSVWLIHHNYPGKTVICENSSNGIMVVGNLSLISELTACSNIDEFKPLDTLQRIEFPYSFETAVIGENYKLLCYYIPLNETTNCKLFKMGQGEKEYYDNERFSLLKEKMIEFINNLNLYEPTFKRSTITEEIIKQLKRLGYLP